MIIAVASEKDKVTDHFGYCENFNIYEVEDKKIVSSKSVPNPGHKHGFLPNFLGDMGVNVVIAGGMGASALGIFKERGIEVFMGVSGEAHEAVKSYIEGSLVSNDSACMEHHHHEECEK